MLTGLPSMRLYQRHHSHGLGNVYTTNCTGYGTLHPDQHAFAFVPGSNPTRFVAAMTAVCITDRRSRRLHPIERQWRRRLDLH